jgi:hypothetical protein
MAKPAGIRASAESWQYAKFHEKYHDLDPNICIKIRRGYSKDPADTKGNCLLTAKGQKHALDHNKIASGSVDLKDVDARWWLLKEGRQSHGRENIKGQIGFLHQRELLECSTSSSRAAQCGLIVGAKDVVILFEPKSRYIQNSVRTHLVDLNGNSPPIDDWAKAFRQNMPPELGKHIKDLIGKSDAEDYSKTITERLKALPNLYKISAYKSSKGGSYTVDATIESDGDTGHRRLGVAKLIPTSATPSPGSSSGTVADILSPMRKKTGASAVKIQATVFPEILWVSSTSGNRADGELEDRAAQFLPDSYLIKINGDFSGYKDFVTYFVNEFGNDEDTTKLITQIVRDQWTQVLMEVVTGAQGLCGRPHWTETQVASSLSEEALTLATMSKFNSFKEVQRQIKRRVSAKSGRTGT